MDTSDRCICVQHFRWRGGCFKSMKPRDFKWPKRLKGYGITWFFPCHAEGNGWTSAPLGLAQTVSPMRSPIMPKTFWDTVSLAMHMDQDLTKLIRCLHRCQPTNIKPLAWWFSCINRLHSLGQPNRGFVFPAIWLRQCSPLSIYLLLELLPGGIVSKQRGKKTSLLSSRLCRGSRADGGNDKLPHSASIVSLFCRLSIWLALFQRYFVPFDAHEQSTACFCPALPPRWRSPDHGECKWDADLQIASLARDPSCIWIRLPPQVGKSSAHRQYLRSLMENFEKQSTFRNSSACVSNTLDIALHFFVIAKDICMKIGSLFFKHSSAPAACSSLGDLTPVESQATAVWEMSGSLQKKEKVRDGKGRPGET